MSDSPIETVSALLRRGTIIVDVMKADLPASDMFGFAERINPKRSFLFVSKVLGRHIPVRPSVMRDTFSRLSSKIDSELPGPVLFIGMAETAVGLGAGVHQEYIRKTGRDDAVFICTTRLPLETELICEFDEEHSHATRHLIHQPHCTAIKQMVWNARSIVLVDDEASTGKTFSNLFAALPREITDRVEKTVLVTLTDWSEGAAEKRMSGDVSSVSLLSGRYRWQPSETDGEMPQVPSISCPEPRGFTLDFTKEWGRLGVRNHSLKLDARLVKNGRTIVLGTGEHVWQPFLLAEKIESEGVDVVFSAVTRSPISIGHTIGNKYEFPDNYAGSVPNYMYNVRPETFDNIILCSETGRGNVSDGLMSALGPNVIVVS